MQTPFKAQQKRQAVADKRAQLIADGVCIKCRENPPAVNVKDGKIGQVCAPCRERAAQLRGNDVEEAPCFLDSADYIQGCSDVLTAITEIGRACTADIKRKMGDKCESASLFDMLGSLEVEKKITSHLVGSLTRWQAVEVA